MVLGFLEWVEVRVSSVIVTRMLQALVLSSFLAVGTTTTTTTATATSTAAAVDHGGLHTTFRQGLQGLWNVVGTWQQATQNHSAVTLVGTWQHVACVCLTCTSAVGRGVCVSPALVPWGEVCVSPVLVLWGEVCLTCTSTVGRGVYVSPVPVLCGEVYMSHLY